MFKFIKKILKIANTEIFPLRIGYLYKSNDNPFNNQYAKVIDVKNGWVKYEYEHCVSSMTTSRFKRLFSVEFSCKE